MSSILDNVLSCAKTPFTKDFWTTTIPTSSKIFFSDWTEASVSISKSLSKYVFSYDPEKFKNSIKNNDSKKPIAPPQTLFGNIAQGIVSSYRKEENSNVVISQPYKPGDYDVRECITNSVKNVANHVVVPSVVGDRTGPVYEGLFTTVILQEYFFRHGDNKATDIPYYITMSAIGEGLVRGANFALGKIANEIPGIKLLSALNYFNPLPNFLLPKNIFLMLATHPEIKKAIQEQTLIKKVNDYAAPVLTSLGNQLVVVGTIIRTFAEQKIVYFIGNAVEAGVNELVKYQDDKLWEQQAQFISQSAFNGFIFFSFVYLSKKGEFIGKTAGTVKECLTNFVVKVIVDTSLNVTKLGFKATVLTVIGYRSLIAFPVFTGVAFIMQGGTKQSTGELLGRIGTVGIMAIGRFTPWFISAPIQIVTILTITGSPGSNLKQCGLRVGGVAIALLASSFIFGGPLVATVAMVGMNFFLEARKQKLESQWRQEIQTMNDEEKRKNLGKRETSFIEDVAAFVQKRNEKMTTFWKGVDLKKNDGVSSEEETSDKKTASLMKTFLCMIAQLTEEICTVRTYTPVPKTKTE